MEWFRDIRGRQLRLTDERLLHLEDTHPEMVGQLDTRRETLLDPERIVQSRSDPAVELYYRHYPATPVSSKFMCAVVKVSGQDAFIVTAYFTDAVKKGSVVWQRKT